MGRTSIPNSAIRIRISYKLHETVAAHRPFPIVLPRSVLRWHAIRAEPEKVSAPTLLAVNGWALDCLVFIQHIIGRARRTRTSVIGFGDQQTSRYLIALYIVCSVVLTVGDDPTSTAFQAVAKPPQLCQVGEPSRI